AKSQSRLHAAVVELDSLTDADGARSQDDHRPALRVWTRVRAGARRVHHAAWSLVLHLECRVVVGRRRLELCGTGVDALVHRSQAQLVAPGAHRGDTDTAQTGAARVPERGSFCG